MREQARIPFDDSPPALDGLLLGPPIPASPGSPHAADLPVVTRDRRTLAARIIHRTAAIRTLQSRAMQHPGRAALREREPTIERRRGTSLACGPHSVQWPVRNPRPREARRPCHPKRQICAQTIGHLTVLTKIHTRQGSACLRAVTGPDGPHAQSRPTASGRSGQARGPARSHQAPSPSLHRHRRRLPRRWSRARGRWHDRACEVASRAGRRLLAAHRTGTDKPAVPARHHLPPNSPPVGHACPQCRTPHAHQPLADRPAGACTNTGHRPYPGGSGGPAQVRPRAGPASACFR